MLGILCGFSMAAVVEARVPRETAWRAIWSLPLPFALIVGFGMWRMPPSPRWLLLIDCHEVGGEGNARGPARARAYSALACFRRGATPAELEAEIVEIEEALGFGASHDSDSEGVERYEVDQEAVRLKQPSDSGPVRQRRSQTSCAELLSAKRALIAGLGLVALQQLTGQPSVLYFQVSRAATSRTV